MLRVTTSIALAASLLVACTDVTTRDDARDDDFLAGGKADEALRPESAAAYLALRVANELAFDALVEDGGIAPAAARAIVAYRHDRALSSLAALDALPYVGPNTFDALVALGRARDLLPAPRSTTIMWDVETWCYGIPDPDHALIYLNLYREHQPDNPCAAGVATVEETGHFLDRWSEPDVISTMLAMGYRDADDLYTKEDTANGRQYESYFAVSIDEDRGFVVLDHPKTNVTRMKPLCTQFLCEW